MLEFSIVDGFMDVNDCLTEMIKYVANEPSVGLFSVQQYTQNAVPNVIKIKDKLAEKSHDTALQTEDLEDSINVVRSMKECGMPIVDEMIKDIKKSLIILSITQPRRGVIHHPSLGREVSLGVLLPSAQVQSWPWPIRIEEAAASTMLNSTKPRATGLRWPQLDPTRSRNLGAEKLLFSLAQSLSETGGNSGLTMPETETDEQHDPTLMLGLIAKLN